jgi:hypothetical protein
MKKIEIIDRSFFDFWAIKAYKQEIEKKLTGEDNPHVIIRPVEFNSLPDHVEKKLISMFNFEAHILLMHRKEKI